MVPLERFASLPLLPSCLKPLLRVLLMLCAFISASSSSFFLGLRPSLLVAPFSYSMLTCCIRLVQFRLASPWLAW